MALAISDGDSYGTHLTTSLADVFECPTGKVAEVKFAQAANVDGTSDADVHVAWYDSSSSGTFYLGSGVTVPAKAGYKPLGELIGFKLKAGDKVQAKASNDGDLDIVISVVIFDPLA